MTFFHIRTGWTPNDISLLYYTFGNISLLQCRKKPDPQTQTHTHKKKLHTKIHSSFCVQFGVMSSNINNARQCVKNHGGLTYSSSLTDSETVSVQRRQLPSHSLMEFQRRLVSDHLMHQSNNLLMSVLWRSFNICSR